LEVGNIWGLKTEIETDFDKSGSGGILFGDGTSVRKVGCRLGITKYHFRAVNARRYNGFLFVLSLEGEFFQRLLE